MNFQHLTVSGATLVAALLWAPFPASAAPLVQWGTAASTTTFECNDAAPLSDPVMNCLTALFTADLSGVPLDASFSPESGGDDGGVMQALATSNLDNMTGKADAEASLVPASGVSTPVLKAFAQSKLDPEGSAVALAAAIEGYTNMSGSTQIYNLNVVLDATIADDTPGDNSTSASAGALVIGIDGDLPDFGISTEELIAFLLLPSVTLLDFIGPLSIDSSSVSQVSDTLQFELGNGQSAYFLSVLEVTAIRDQSVSDAFGTLTASFDNPVGLVSASNSVVVTEPATTALLLLVGLLGLSVRRRRSTT